MNNNNNNTRHALLFCGKSYCVSGAEQTRLMYKLIEMVDSN